MRTTAILTLSAVLAVTAGTAACAQILGIQSDAHVGTGGTGGTGGATTQTGPCTPGDAGSGAGSCGAGRYCDPTALTCVAACQGSLGVRITTDLSGTAQDIAQPYNQAIYDYMRELNATRGGIRGCPIDVDMQDGNYTSAVTQQDVTTWSTDPSWAHVQTLFIFGTAPTTTVTQMPVVAGKVIIPGSYAGAFDSPKPVSTSVTYTDFNSAGQSTPVMATESSPGYPYLFYPATDYSTGIRIAIHAAWQRGAGKMAMVYDKTCAYCTSPLVAGKAFFSSSSVPGMTLVPDVDDVPQTSDTTMIPTIAAQIRALVGAEITKVNASPGSYYPLRWLWCGNSVTSCAGVAKGAGQGNADIKAMVPAANQWTVQVIANNWGIGETSSSLCGTGDGNKGDCDEVLFGLFPVPRYGDTSAGGMQAMIALHDKWGAADNTDGGTNTYADVRFVQGYAAALMWQRAVEAALDAGHATPTGDDIKAALEAFTNVSLQGMTAGPISFTGKDHRPQGTEAVYYLHQGTLTFDTTYSLTLDPTWIGY